jgi:hypothetical protein
LHFARGIGRFWRNDPLGPLGDLNMIGTDTVAERIWNLNPLQPDPTMGMLQSYLADENALSFARIPPNEPHGSTGSLPITRRQTQYNVVDPQSSNAAIS